jgi:hypothetical protein
MIRILGFVSGVTDIIWTTSSVGKLDQNSPQGHEVEDFENKTKAEAGRFRHLDKSKHA